MERPLFGSSTRDLGDATLFGVPIFVWVVLLALAVYLFFEWQHRRDDD